MLIKLKGVMREFPAHLVGLDNYVRLHHIQLYIYVHGECESAIVKKVQETLEKQPQKTSGRRPPVMKQMLLSRRERTERAYLFLKT